MLLSSVSVVVLGSNRPFLFPTMRNFIKYITCSKPPDNSDSTNRRVDNWDCSPEFWFKHAIEILTSSNWYKTVSIGQFWENSDVIGILKLASISH